MTRDEDHAAGPTTVVGRAVEDSRPIPGDPLGRHTVDVMLSDSPAFHRPGRPLDVEALDTAETNRAAGDWPTGLAHARQLCRDLMATIRRRKR